MIIDLEQPQNHTLIAAMVGKSQQAVSKLVKKCLLPSSATNGEVVEALFARLSDQAAGRGGEDQKLLTQARIASELAKAEGQQLQNLEKKGQLIAVDDMEPLLEQWAMIAAAEFGNAINKIVADIEGSAEITVDQEMVKKHAASALKIVGRYPRGIEEELEIVADSDDEESGAEMDSTEERTNA